MRKRIIHVPRRFVAEEWGGTETVILEISRCQQQAGWRPEVFTSLALARRREEELQRIPIRRFPYFYPVLGLTEEERLALDKKGGNLFSFSLLRALLTAPEVRLFHAHALSRLGGIVRLAARWRRIPYIVSLHGGVFDVPAQELETMRKPMAGKWDWGKPLSALVGARQVLSDADHVICVGQNEYEAARRQLPHARVSYLPNGVDTRRFQSGDGRAFRQQQGLPEDAFVVLNVSRLDAQKNQRLLVEAFRQLRPDNRPFYLVLIGPCTQPEYVEQLKTAIQQGGQADRVRLLPGFPPYAPELINAYHACDVFVLPSIHEPFGIVVLEAWSCGKPVIASRVGGLTALVEDKVTGLFIDVGSPQADGELATLIRTLANDPGLRQRLGESGRKEAVHRYGWPSIAQQLENIYAAACSREMPSNHPVPPRRS